MANTKNTAPRTRKVAYTESLCIDPGANRAMFVACVLAQHFSRSKLNVETLCNRFGMSRANAYRWRRAWLDATGAGTEVTTTGRMQ